MFSISSSSCDWVRFWVPCKMHQHAVLGGAPGRGRASDLEGKVLEEVGGAIRLVSLGAGAGVNPHSHGRCLGPGRVLGGDLGGFRVSKGGSGRRAGQLGGGELTVRPFLSVVVCVFAPMGEATGVAKPRFNGLRAGPAARLRIPWARFNASLRDAIGTVMGGRAGRGFVVEGG